MTYKQHIIRVTIAALMTAVIHYLWNTTPIFTALYKMIDPTTMWNLQLVLIPATAVLVEVIAAIPGMIFLRWQKIPHYLILSFLASVILICLPMGFTLVFGYFDLLPIWYFMLYYILLIPVYLSSDFLFNKWRARFRTKLFVALGIITAIPILTILGVLLSKMVD